MAGNRENKHIARVKQSLGEGKIDRREFLRTTTLLGLSAAAAYAFADRVSGTRASTAAAADMPKGGVIRIGNRVDAIGEPHSMVNIQSGIIARQVFDYLTDTGIDNITRPSLLEGWEVSDDLRTWTLRLRKDVKWRKGRQFVADDVVWNIQHVLEPKTGSSMVGLMKGYMMNDAGDALWDANAIEKVDDYTVRLNCRVPQLAVPEHLFHYPMVIQDPEEGGAFNVGSNATGPFELVQYDTQQVAVFRPNKTYWGEGPYVDELRIVHLGDDPAAAIAAMASKQIEGLYQANIKNVEALEKLSHLQYYSAQTATTMVARGKYNLEPFSDPRVRQALRLAVNQEEVMQVAARGGAVGQHHHVASIHPEYADLPPIKQDIEAARKLIAEAGYPDGLDLEIAAPADETWMVNGLQVMVQHWQQANIRVKMNVYPGALFWENWLKHPFSVTNWNHRPLGIMVLGIAYRSGVPWNESEFANPEFDRLLTEAEGLVDVDKRREVMAKIEKIMQEDGPIVQPFWTPIFTFYDKRVKGFQMHPSFYIYGNRLAIEA